MFNSLELHIIWEFPMGRIISVISGKGGVGKTTVIINSGVALARNFNKKAIVIDCNLTTSHLGMALGIHQAQVALNHVLRGEAELEESIYTHNSGLHVMPASVKLHEMQGVDLMKLKPLAKKLAEKYDYVLLDAGPGLGREALSALHSSQEVVFVTTPTLPAVMDVVRYMEFLRTQEKTHLGLVLNMVAKNESQLTSKQVEQMTSLPIITSVPRDSAVPRALAAEVPAVLSFPDSRASKEFVNVARHMAGLPVVREVKISTLDSITARARNFLEKAGKYPSLD
jgi:septum site-determining protein MinD